MQYKTTKEQSAKKIIGVCSQCSGKIEPLKTVDNSGTPTYWNGCIKCQRFDNGIDPKIYAIAKAMVTERNFKYYSHLEDKESDSEDIKQYNLECQISGACGIVRDILFLWKNTQNQGEVT